MHWQYQRAFRQACLTDPLEYDGRRRRDFWKVMRGRAARGDWKAISNLELRKGYSAEGGKAATNG